MALEIRIDPRSNNGEIIITANQSASWRTNMRFFTLLAAVSLSIAFSFSFFAGAWLVLPFAGLELALVFFSLHHLCSSLSKMQVIRFTADEVIVEKGIKHPDFQWRAQRLWTKAHVQEPAFPNQRSSIYIAFKGQRIGIGEFLHEHEKDQLIRSLRGLISVI